MVSPTIFQDQSHPIWAYLPMFESFSNSDNWSEGDRWCGSKGILKKNCHKFEVNQISLLGIIEMSIMNLVGKSYRIRFVKRCYWKE